VNRILLALAGLALACQAGCSSLETGEFKDERFAVKGTVNLDGKPLESGTIAFVGEGEKQRPAGGPIVAGKFEIPQGQGPNAGKYKVQVRSLKSTGKKFKDSDTGEMKDVMEESLPKRYHDNTILTATVGEQTEFTFDLVSK
jgi:hypothetical protein